LYAALIVVTVFAVFSSVALAYIKLFVSARGIFIEAPFLNFAKHYKISQLNGFKVTREPRQRWFLLRELPRSLNKMEDVVTLSTFESPPKWFEALALGARIAGQTVVFRPKSMEKFVTAMDRLSVRRMDVPP